METQFNRQIFPSFPDRLISRGPSLKDITTENKYRTHSKISVSHGDDYVLGCDGYLRNVGKLQQKIVLHMEFIPQYQTDSHLHNRVHTSCDHEGIRTPHSNRNASGGAPRGGARNNCLHAAITSAASLRS
jgi:hypothetical protein